MHRSRTVFLRGFTAYHRLAGVGWAQGEVLPVLARDYGYRVSERPAGEVTPHTLEALDSAVAEVRRQVGRDAIAGYVLGEFRSESAAGHGQAPVPHS